MTGTARTSTRGRRRPARRSRSDTDEPVEPAESAEPDESAGSRRERRYERRQERYDRRHRPSRRRYLARRWVAVLVVLAVLGLTYVIMFTSLVGVRAVEVLGTREISREAVAEAAAIEPGSPMVRLDTDEVARRVARLPRVAEVSVSRSFPSTVEIQVTERRPVAVVPDEDGVHLVDRTGMSYATVSARPAGLPVLKVIRVAPDDPATHAAVTVLGAIPDQLRERMVELSARTPGDVQLKLADGRVIKWGDAEDNGRKAAVLAPLLTRPGKTYDVATPDFPTVS